jgi:hypothetical protein
MDEPPPDPRRRRTLAVRTVITALAVAVTLILTHRPGAWLPDVPLPDLSLPDLSLPDGPGWLWPTVKWTKLAVLVVIGGLALAGAFERSRRRDRHDDGGSR